jgi:hypothetical protein
MKEDIYMYGFVPVVIVLFLLIAIPVLFGELSSRLAHQKGYLGYFWTGFFLGFIGLVYVGFLPDKSHEQRGQHEQRDQHRRTRRTYLNDEQ